MKILYVAKHDSGDNDDEGAIAYALRELGHEVVLVHEMRRHRTTAQTRQLYDTYDFCLFHKWPTVSEIAQLHCPSAFWYFDMVRSVDGDTSLRARSEQRVQWMRDVLAIPNVVAGFCTDGDWALTHRKLVHLMQGADERVMGYGEAVYDLPPILFTGMINHGKRRVQHVARLQERYGDKFMVFGDAQRDRKHGKDLANVFASTKIVVAPDGPSTDMYWSNRVWLTLSLGGFLLHPHCNLLDDYFDSSELVTYKDRDHLEALIDKFLDDEQGRERYRVRGHSAVKNRHLYRHRCAMLIRHMESIL